MFICAGVNFGGRPGTGLARNASTPPFRYAAYQPKTVDRLKPRLAAPFSAWAPFSICSHARIRNNLKRRVVKLPSIVVAHNVIKAQSPELCLPAFDLLRSNPVVIPGETSSVDFLWRPSPNSNGDPRDVVSTSRASPHPDESCTCGLADAISETWAGSRRDPWSESPTTTTRYADA